jgi:arabinose-5-phosphate isomerase
MVSPASSPSGGCLADNPRMSQPTVDFVAAAVASARATLATEAAAVADLAQRLGQPFGHAVHCMLHCAGRVVVMGMGKSGHVGGKIAATLASTGTPAFFVHPAEASHGDLGMLTARDVALAISNSGQSEELLVLLPLIKRMGVPLLVMTGAPDSALAQAADVVLDSAVTHEACPHNLAPTASTTAQLALGDALAVALLQQRGFAPEDFARSHPGGALGRRLLTRVADLMRRAAAMPLVAPQDRLLDVLPLMSEKGLGLVVAVDAARRVQGVLTDGDLRRLLAQGGDVRTLTVAQVMQRQPRHLAPEALAAEAARVMEEQRITSVLAVDDQGVLQGVLNSNDLMRARVI